MIWEIGKLFKFNFNAFSVIRQKETSLSHSLCSLRYCQIVATNKFSTTCSCADMCGSIVGAYQPSNQEKLHLHKENQGRHRTKTVFL